jgi:hypothetical protein
MDSKPLDPDQSLEQHIPPDAIPGDIRGPYQHHKDKRVSLEPIFSILLNHPMVMGFMTGLAKKTNIQRSTLSIWKRDLLRDPRWHPRRDHSAQTHQNFTDEQELELPDRIAKKYIEKRHFYIDGEFKIDTPRFFSGNRMQK